MGRGWGVGGLVVGVNRREVFARVYVGLCTNYRHKFGSFLWLRVRLSRQQTVLSPGVEIEEVTMARDY